MLTPSTETGSTEPDTRTDSSTKYCSMCSHMLKKTNQTKKFKKNTHTNIQKLTMKGFIISNNQQTHIN